MTSTSENRVQSGIPWWLWLLMLTVCGGVLAAIVINLVPDDPSQRYQQGLAAYEATDRETLRKALAALEGRPEYLSRRQLLEGLDLMSTSRPVKAAPLFRQAAEDPQIRAQALTFLGQALSRGEQRQQAIEVLETAVHEGGDDEAARSTLGMILFEIGAYEQALAVLEPLKGVSGRNGMTSHGLRGEMLMDMGRFQEAADEFQQALEADPLNPAARSVLVKCVDSQMKADDFAGANETMDLLEPSPDKESFKAVLLVKLGKTDDAARTIESASGGAEEMAPASVQLKRAEALLGAGQGAEKARRLLIRLRESVPMHSRDQDFYQALAQLARAAEQPEEAELYERNQQRLQELREEYWSLLPQVTATLDDLDGRLRLGDLAAEFGDYDRARTWYQTVMKIDPGRAADVELKTREIYYHLPELVSTAAFRSAPPATPSAGSGQQQQENLPE